MLGKKYLDEVQALLGRVEETQLSNIERAAEMIADSIASGGAVHLMDTGHLLMQEMFGRAGGLMLLRPITIEMNVNNPGPKREGKRKPKVYLDEIPGLPEFIFDRSDLFPGDVLIIGSVSGKNVLPAGLALLARERGVKVIALTSVEYSNHLTPEHPSGKRLYETADVVLDNCGVIGDGVLDVEGMPMKVCPTSGVAAACIMWTLEAEVIEKLLERGIQPHAYLSNHMPGADKLNADSLEQYEKLGY